MNELVIPMPGLHNISNATAAIAVALELGVDESGIRKGLAQFSGVKRRFTNTGQWKGVQIIDDYAHHPVEITSVLKAARIAAGNGRVIAVKQPHRFTRLRDLYGEFCACFNDADTVLVAPVYRAGEEPIEGYDEASLVAGLISGGHRDARAIAGHEGLATLISQIAKSGDYVIFLGAGDISQWANALPGELEALDSEAV